MSSARVDVAPDRAWRMPIVILAAAGLASTAPLLVLLAGPILFGVPHVLGDVRVLWLARPGGFGGRAAWLAAAALLAMTCLRVTNLFDGAPRLQLELLCGIAAIAIAATSGARTMRRRVAWALSLALAAWVSWLHPRACILALAHGHNVIALVVWLAWRPLRAGSIRVVALYGLGAAFVALATTGSIRGESVGGLDGARILSELAPQLTGELADAVVRSFAFAQLVHYGIWAWDLPGGTRWDVRAQLGGLGFGACVILILVVPLLGIFAPAETRSTYLQVALAHGWLELTVGAYLLAKGVRS